MDLFKKETPKDAQRKTEQEIKRTQRNLTRNNQCFDKEKQRITSDIKKYAKEGNMTLAKKLAKDLIRIQDAEAKNSLLSSNLSSINTSSKLAVSSVEVANSMGKVSANLGKILNQNDVAKTQKILQDFSKAQMRLELNDEMMNDVIDSIQDVDEGEVNLEVDKVLDSLGIEISGSAPTVPNSKLPSGSKETNDIDEDRIMRLLKDIE